MLRMTYYKDARFDIWTILKVERVPTTPDYEMTSLVVDCIPRLPSDHGAFTQEVVI